MIKKFIPEKSSSILSNLAVFMFVFSLIYGLLSFAKQWEASFNPVYNIDLSLAELPMYALYSALRGFIAYLLSLIFTLFVGYWAAKSEKAEKLIIPFLDIMQSIPVLGFLPGLVLGLVSMFPRSNVGLELAAIIMIFTGQVWNMTFAFYSSLKSVPNDLKEASQVMGLTWWRRLRILELPFSAMNLTWNSVMSMAGGWFFLTVCEAFTLGDQKYRLPGLGSFMATAIDAGDTKAIIAGIASMFAVIIAFDILLWRPALYLAHRYRLEDPQSGSDEEGKLEDPLLQTIINDSVISKILDFYYTKRHQRKNDDEDAQDGAQKISKRVKVITLVNHLSNFLLSLKGFIPVRFGEILTLIFGVSGGGIIVYALFLLLSELQAVELSQWLTIIRDTLLTLSRVMFTVAISTIWAAPFAIWVAQSPKRLRRAQPLIQLMASFPAPMLYPMAMAVFLYLNIHFELGSMLLMLLGVQWYVLFNVLAGALRIPTELKLMMKLQQVSTFQKWRYLYFPSVFPALVTGWVTAAGGAWNASIVAELVQYKGKSYIAHGLGADISLATEAKNFPMLAACLLVMILVVVLLNRSLWAKIYKVVQTRYRLDL